MLGNRVLMFDSICFGFLKLSTAFCLQDEELYHLFYSSVESASNVEAVRVVRDPYTSLGKGIAYVLFRSRV